MCVRSGPRNRGTKTARRSDCLADARQEPLWPPSVTVLMLESARYAAMPIQPVLIRRVSRVRDRMEPTDPGDAILDDVIVLWRAFEATFDRSKSDEQNEMAGVA